MAQGDRQICILCIAALGGERPDLQQWVWVVPCWYSWLQPVFAGPWLPLSAKDGAARSASWEALDCSLDWVFGRGSWDGMLWCARQPQWRTDRRRA